MSFSNFTAHNLLNSLFGKTSDFGALAAPPTIHVGLSTADPGETGANAAEPSGGNYARVATVAGDWNAATDADPSVVNNANAITFNTANASWGNCTHVVLYDAASSGNFLGANQLTTSKEPGDGDTPSFAASALSITLD